MSPPRLPRILRFAVVAHVGAAADAAALARHGLGLPAVQPWRERLERLAAASEEATGQKARP